MIRVGVVGCGYIGTVHAYALERLGAAGLVEAGLVAAYDPEPERSARLARHHGGRAVGSVAALVEAVDVVWVCTWTSSHHAAVTAAAEAGRAVFCEKPLGVDLADATRVAEVLATVPHQVGLVLRGSPALECLAGLVASGRYGSPMLTVLRDDQFFPIQGMYRSTWRADADRAGGGTLLEHSIHDLDLFRWLLGDPVDVSARVSSTQAYPGIDDVAAVTCTYPDGSSAMLASVWHQVLSRPSSRRIELFCTDALVTLDEEYLGPLTVQTSQGTETITPDPPAWLERLAVPAELAAGVAMYAAPTKSFLDGLAAGDGRPARPDAADALRAHRLVDAAYRSAAAGGARVAVPAAPAAPPVP